MAGSDQYDISMNNRPEFSVDYQVRQARKVKSLTAENNKLREENIKLKKEIEDLRLESRVE